MITAREIVNTYKCEETVVAICSLAQLFIISRRIRKLWQRAQRDAIGFYILRNVGMMFNVFPNQPRLFLCSIIH